jgi:hypothetical protein
MVRGTGLRVRIRTKMLVIQNNTSNLGLFLCTRVYHEAVKVGLRTGTELGQDGENTRRNVHLHLLHSLRAKPTHHRLFFVYSTSFSRESQGEKPINFIFASSTITSKSNRSCGLQPLISFFEVSKKKILKNVANEKNLLKNSRV